MTLAIGIALALLGLLAVLIGFGMFMMFRIGIRVFDRSLKSELALQGREQVERAAMAIKNPLVRNFVLNHMVSAGGAIAVSIVRGELQSSRKRLGLWIACAGAAAVAAAFYTGRWLPLVWNPS